MMEAGHQKVTYENVWNEWREWEKREKEARESEPVFLDHVRTSSGVRFRGYYIYRKG